MTVGVLCKRNNVICTLIRVISLECIDDKVDNFQNSMKFNSNILLYIDLPFSSGNPRTSEHELKTKNVPFIMRVAEK